MKKPAIETKKTVTVKLPTRLYAEIKKLAIDLDKEVYTLFEEALTDLLCRNNRPPQAHLPAAHATGRHKAAN